MHRNVRLNREAGKGFAAPGIVTVSIDGIGDISVYHANLFLGRLRQNELVTRENDALASAAVERLICPVLTRAAKSIAIALSVNHELPLFTDLLFYSWTNTIARVCIGLRRLNTGGSFLITSTPNLRMLDVVHRLRYRRLSDAMILGVLDAQYREEIKRQVIQATFSGTVAGQLSHELSRAECDAEDRADELTGAVKLVTSLAAADGVVLMDLSLKVLGFGVKIKSSRVADTVYDAGEFARKSTNARKIDPSRFGTRHGSMMRYCRADRDAIGVVISQDGHVRVIMSSGRSLTLWDNVKLLEHDENVTAYAQHLRHKRSNRDDVRRLLNLRKKVTLGYTAMPKTVEALLALGEE